MLDKTIYSNEEIIDGIKTNNFKIVTFIYNSYYPLVENLIVHVYNGTIEDAKDVFQDALIVLYRGACSTPQLKINYSFLTFFTTVCRRKMIGKFRKDIKIDVIDESEKMLLEEDLDIVEMLTAADRMSLYQKYFNELGEKCKELLQLFFEGYSLPEISQRMKIGSINYTKKRRSLCKDTLFLKIYDDPQFKELIHGEPLSVRKVPRW